MKRTGKGLGINITNVNSISSLNKFNMALANVSEGVPIVPFRPLQVKTHPRSEDMRVYAALPSRFA